VIYVYAIAERGPGVPPPLAPLRTLNHARLAGIYGAPPDELAPTIERLREHERVVEELMAERPLLPLRFGSVMPDESELRDLLAARQSEFEAALARVRGHVELGVRASAGGPRGTSSAADGGAAAELPGSAYLSRKLAAKRLAQQLHDALAPAADDAHFRMGRDDGYAGAYLVERAAVHEFCSRVDELRVEHPGLEIALTGPWPPYSFTEAAAS
jgi:hypothetical protein